MANDVDRYNSSMVLQGTYDSPELALAAANDGDVIEVGETDSPYLGQVLDINGFSGLTLRAKSGEAPVISGANAALASAPNALWTSYGTVAGRAVYYATYSFGSNNVTALRTDGTRLWTYGTWAGFSSFYCGEGIYHDDGANRLYIWLREDTDPNTVALWISEDDYVIRINDSSDVTIGTAEDDVLTVQVGGESVIQIRYDSTGSTIQNCVIRWGQRGVWFKEGSSNNDCSDTIIDTCTIYDSYKRHEWAWRHAKSTSYDSVRKMETSGLNVQTGGSGIEFIDCTLYGWFDGVSIGREASGTPYLSGLKCYGRAFGDFVIYDCRDDAINVEGYHQDTQVYNISVYDAYIGVAAMPCQRGPAYIFRNRIITDRMLYYDQFDEYDEGRGTKIGDHSGDDSLNVKIYQNTFWSYYDCVDEDDANPPDDFEFRNNIFRTLRRGGTFASITRDVAASSDDAEENTGTGAVTLNSTDLDLGTDIVGIRFTNVTEDDPDDVVCAILQLRASATAAAGGGTRIYGEAADDASTFTTGANDISSRSTTTAVKYFQFESWTSGDTIEINVTPIVKEILERGGWSSGNALAFLLKNPFGTNHPVDSYDAGSNEPRLIVYTLNDVGAGTGRCVSGTGYDDDGNVFDYNAYDYETDIPSDTVIVDWNATSGSYSSLAAAIASTPGQDAGWEDGTGIEGDMGLDESEYPYPLTITSTSPAYNAGQSLPSGWPDTGVVTDGYPDMGYYEVGVAQPVTNVYKDDANLVALYLLEEASGTRYDDTDNDNDLTDNNTVTQSADAQEGSYSADFETANNEFLNIGDGSQTGLDITGNLSIALWLKPETIDQYGLVGKYTTTGNQRSYLVWMDSGGNVRCNLSSDGTSYISAEGGTALSAGTWYHVVVVYNGSDVRIYLNGLLDSNGAYNPYNYSSGIYNGTSDFGLGYNQGGAWYYDGLLDEVAVFDRALSASEVRGIYNNGILDAEETPVVEVSTSGLAWVVYKLVVNNTSGVRQAEITDFLELAYTKKVNEPGLAVVTFGGDHSIVSTLGHKYQVEVWRTLPRHGIDWYRDFSGLFMAQERFYTDQGCFVLRAPGDMIQLDWRDVLWYANTSNRSAFSSQPAETILKTLVDYNAGANATTGNGRVRTGTITGLSVETDGGGGNSINWTCAWKNLLKELQDIARVAGGDFDLVKTGAAAWEFRWYTGQRGTDRSSTVIFALERGNMANPVYRYNRMAERTVAAVGGRGQGSARTIVTRTGDDYGASNDVEMFVNAGNLTLPASLNAVGDEKLEQARARQEFGFQALQTPACLYGKHYCVEGELGDLVTARYDTIEVTQKIVGVTVTLAADGRETIDPEMETQ